MPPRRPGKITKAEYVVRFRSNSRSSIATNSLAPSSNEASTSLTTAFESPVIADGMLTSPNELLTSHIGESSFATTSSRELQEETLAPVSPGKLNVMVGAEKKMAASSGLLGPDMNLPDATENKDTARKLNTARAEDLIDGKTERIGKGDTKAVSEGVKKKVVKKKMNVMKVVKRIVPRMAVKGSLQTELADKKEKIPNLILHKHNENSESIKNISSSMEVENGDPIPVTIISDSIKTDNNNLIIFVPLEAEGNSLKESIVDSMGVEKTNSSCEDGDPIRISTDSIKTDNTNLTKIVPLELEGESLKESVVHLIGVEKVNPSSEDTLEGESTISSGVSTSGITLENESRGRIENQSVVPMEDKACVGKEFVESIEVLG